MYASFYLWGITFINSPKTGLSAYHMATTVVDTGAITKTKQTKPLHKYMCVHTLTHTCTDTSDGLWLGQVAAVLSRMVREGLSKKKYLI